MYRQATSLFFLFQAFMDRLNGQIVNAPALLSASSIPGVRTNTRPTKAYQKVASKANSVLPHQHDLADPDAHVAQGIADLDAIEIHPVGNGSPLAQRRPFQFMARSEA